MHWCTQVTPVTRVEPGQSRKLLPGFSCSGGGPSLGRVLPLFPGHHQGAVVGHELTPVRDAGIAGSSFRLICHNTGLVALGIFTAWPKTWPRDLALNAFGPHLTSEWFVV